MLDIVNQLDEVNLDIQDAQNILIILHERIQAEIESGSCSQGTAVIFANRMELLLSLLCVVQRLIKHREQTIGEVSDTLSKLYIKERFT